MDKKRVIAVIWVCFCFTHLYAKTVKILAIGNSFSENAVEKYLYDIAITKGDTLIIGNMYIGGCSLETHWNNANTDAPAYSYRKINTEGIKTTTEKQRLSEVIPDEGWDYISFQQVSQNSGIYETYFPYLPNLLSYVKTFTTNPNVIFVMHQTWAYAQTSIHSGFVNYDNNQKTMYAAIVDAIHRVTTKIGIDIVIPSGTAIQSVRTSFVGDNLCYDGYHLNELGRYIAACTWYEKLLRKSVINNPFIPSGLSLEEIKLAQNAAHNAVLMSN